MYIHTNGFIFAQIDTKTETTREKLMSLSFFISIIWRVHSNW